VFQVPGKIEEEFHIVKYWNETVTGFEETNVKQNETNKLLLYKSFTKGSVGRHVDLMAIFLNVFIMVPTYGMA
jgi:hypothetical protein